MSCFKNTVSILTSVVMVSVAFTFSNVALADDATDENKPYFEVVDHARGIKITTFSQDWSFSPLSRHGISLIHTHFSTLEFNRGYAQNYKPEQMLASEIKDAKKNKNIDILDEAMKVQVGNIEVVCLSYTEIDDKKKLITGFFENDGKMFELELEAEQEHYDEFMKSANQVLKHVEFLNSKK